VAATWDAREDVHWFAEHANATLAQRVGPLLGSWSGVRALDFGCGTGLLTEHLAARCREVVAVDPSPGMIRQLEEKIDRHGLDNVRALEVDLEGDPPSGPFDLVVASSVCAFLGDYPGTLRRLVERLRPGGIFVQWDWQKTARGAQFGLVREDIDAAFAHAGLERVHAGLAFELETEEQREPVLMAIGRRRAVVLERHPAR